MTIIPIRGEQVPDGYRPWRRDAKGTLFAVGARELTAAEWADLDLAAAEADEQERAEEEILARYPDVHLHELSDDELTSLMADLGL
jgi:hypothetical protein